MSSRSIRFRINLWPYCLRHATDCAKPALPPASRLQAAGLDAELAWWQLWPNMASLMWLWLELEMSWECNCVCGSKAELSFSFSLLYSTSLRSAFVLLSVLDSPLPQNHPMVCCQLDTEPRAVRQYSSEITRRVGV